jgi:hypothetical protein
MVVIGSRREGRHRTNATKELRRWGFLRGVVSVSRVKVVSRGK